MKILVVDDKPDILDVLRLILEMEGYDVLTESSGAKVLPLMHAEQPDLLLLDVWLPGCDGRNLCRQIKQQESLRHIPVLLMSAHRDVQQMAAQAGAVGSLQKPFQMSTLLSTIASALEQRLC
ncbi:MAG TPA: response regulator [Ktedonosporobacter sp.]|nr:response regulator [Ktedonosporobacter sp.]